MATTVIPIKVFIKCLMGLHIFNKIWNLATDIHKVPNIKFHINPFSGKRTNSRGRTGGHDEGNRHLS
jgi:hypothetical protein